MSNDLRQALRELAETAPMAPAGVASGALREATRRRRRRVVMPTAVTMVGVLVLLGLSGLLAPLGRLAPVTLARGSGVLGHPVRVQAPLPWQHRTLTGAPGRMAGILRDSNGYWHLLTPGGSLIDLPPATMITPTLSEDGRQLAYLRRDGGVLITRNLVTGKVRRHPAVPTNGTGPRTTGSAQPVFWSHDGTRVAVGVLGDGRVVGLGPVVVLDVRTEAMVDVDVRGALVGWGAGDETLVGVTSAPDGPWTDLVVNQVLLSTGSFRTDRVQVAGFRPAGASSSFVSVSPDGELLGLGWSAYVDVVKIARSHWRGGSGNMGGSTLDCARPSWRGTRPIVLAQDDPAPLDNGGTRLQVQSAYSYRLVTVFDPRLTIVCADMVSAALDGPALGGGTWGLSTSWWSWRWREVLAAAALLAMTLAIFAPWRLIGRRRLVDIQDGRA